MKRFEKRRGVEGSIIDSGGCLTIFDLGFASPETWIRFDAGKRAIALDSR